MTNKKNKKNYSKIIDIMDRREYVVAVKGIEIECLDLMRFVNIIDFFQPIICPQRYKESWLLHLGGFNLSWNHLSGGIPISIGSLQYFDTLDLPHNYLSVQSLQTCPSWLSRGIWTRHIVWTNSVSRINLRRKPKFLQASIVIKLFITY